MPEAAPADREFVLETADHEKPDERIPENAAAVRGTSTRLTQPALDGPTRALSGSDLPQPLDALVECRRQPVRRRRGPQACRLEVMAHAAAHIRRCAARFGTAPGSLAAPRGLA